MRRPRCTPSAQTEQTSGHTFLHLPGRTCDPYARDLRGRRLGMHYLGIFKIGEAFLGVGE